MGLLDGPIAAALKAITPILGVDCVLSLPNQGYSFAQGAEVPKAVSRWDAKVFPPSAVNSKLVDGKTILAGDVSFFMPAVGTPVEPTPKHLLEFKGDVFRIIQAPRGYSGDGVFGYTLLCRR